MSFERTGVSVASLDDLDRAGMEAYVRERAEVPEGEEWQPWGQRMGLLARTASRWVPTSVSLVLFGIRPQLIHPEWGLSAVQVRGVTLADDIQQRADLEGPLEALLEAGLAFVEEATTQLDEGGEYPPLAVREALVNALVHRDLRRPSRVSLRLFDDRLELHNPGGVGETVGDIEEWLQRGGISHARNPLLVAHARGLGLVEQLGRGLACMRRAMGEGASRSIELRVSPRDFQVTIPSRFRLMSRTPS